MTQPKRLGAALGLLILASAGDGRAMGAATREAGGMWTLTNETLTVTLDPKAATFSARSGPRTFIPHGRLGPPADADPVTGVRPSDVHDSLGTGRALEVTRRSGRLETLILYDGLPWVCAKVSEPGAADRAVTRSTVATLEAALDAGADLRAFGPAGAYALGGDRDHFAVAAVAHPRTRAGVVCGWLTHHRASGVVSVRSQGGTLAMAARSEYGRVVQAPGQRLEGEVLAIGWFDDGLDGLEAYAAAVARAHQVRLPKHVPSGYCTWYHAGALDEKRMAELAAWCQEHLARFGLDFLQIDDGWQVSRRDFTTHNPKGRYPGGMKATADAVTRAGLTAGIWFIPFGWDPARDGLKDHPDWFVHRADGSPYEVKWAGTCLDMTHPEAREFLRGVVRRMTRQWGYKYIKIDGLWTGLAARILYPDPAYRDDGLGDAVFHNPAKPNLEVYRDGLRLVREAAGPDVFILGCNVAQNLRTMGGSVGLVDGMRIGPDVGARWAGVVSCARPTTHLYFWHGATWFNDPDCLMLRPPLTLDQGRAWGSLIALSGQMIVVSEWLPGLDAERLDVLKRTIPNHGGRGRPIDLFGDGLPRLWHLRADLGGQRRDLVGLFNWNEKEEAEVAVDLAALGLPASPQDEYVAFDFWEHEFVGPVTQQVAARLRPSSCRVFSLVRAADRPQLVSTSRHVTQGAVDVVSTQWDAEKKVLRGRSRVVGGDPYELRIATGGRGRTWKPAAAGLGPADGPAGATIAMEPSGPWLRVKIAAPENREVAWQVTFE